jgi:ankyrin repeat protein
MIFDFIKNKDFDGLKKYIETNINDDNLDLDIYDSHHNYFIQYLITYNLIDIIKIILLNKTIRLDIVDTDGRNILYIPIKFNYIELLELLIMTDKKNIGISIIDMSDNLGYTCLHYAIIYNNFTIFKILYKIIQLNNDKNNYYTICLQYKRTDIFLYLLENELKNTFSISKYINDNGESILQSALTYDNEIILEYIINNKKLLSLIVNNKEQEYGLTALHQCIVLNKNNYAMKLIEQGGDINISDYIGNTPLHYACIEKNFDFINSFVEINKSELSALTGSNLNGDTVLHLLLESDVISSDIVNNRFQYNYLSILEKILLESNINTMNNMGITCLYLIVKKNLWTLDSIQKILCNGITHMNIFIENKYNESILNIVSKNVLDKFIDLVVDSYYNILKNVKNKKDLVVDWEQYCVDDDIQKLKALYKKSKNNDHDAMFYCKEYIKEVISTKKRSIPLYNELNLNIESGVYKDGCYYIGSTIDILFGLLYLYKEFNNIEIILEYPLTDNKELELYYKKIGINYSYKVDFSNIEIIWSFQKIIYMTNFDSIFLNRLNFTIANNKQFIVIPLGIEVANGSHANIIIIDTTNKTIERFEPNGKNNPHNLYYNMELLDETLVQKFSKLIPQYKYLKPSDFLPDIGFQILETLEDEKCKRLGDPNGFCAVWCVWWVEQRISNDVKPNILSQELIKTIRLSGKSFKNLIRNYSMNIIKIRDIYLTKYNMDINDWITNNYDIETIKQLEKDILNEL